MRIGIVVDSACDLPLEYLERNNIVILPITVRIGEAVLADHRANPEKGTGAVMCCTFGDVTDVAWWREHNLPLRLALRIRRGLH